MKTKYLFAWAIVMAICSVLSAQTTFDAAKLYDEELNGTARYVGMGGAMSALGSDVSVISHNPAGIGTYRSSDLNTSISFFGSSVNIDPLVTKFSPGLVNNKTYYSHNNKTDLILSFDNLSIVFSGYDQGDSYMNFGFSYRKLNNISRSLDYYDSYPDEDGYEVWREYVDNQRNTINSYDFNLSCNFSDLLYTGVTFGILSTKTESEGHFYDFYGENMHPDYPDGLDYTVVDKWNYAEGKGFNMALGLIVRPVSALRLGLSFKTPTWFKQKLEYEDFLYADRGEDKKDENGNVNSYYDSQDYKFSSPWSINLSAGLTFGKTAIGAEFERHYTQRSSLSIGNTKMESQGAIALKDYSTYKIGLEQNIGNLAFRLGYNYIEPKFKDNSGPYLNDSKFNQSRKDFQVDRLTDSKSYTCGIGYCSEPDYDGGQFYFDVAYVHSIRNSDVNVNEYNDDVDMKYNFKTDKVMFTIGWNF